MTGLLARTEYKLDAGSWTTGTSVTVGTVGVHTLLYRSTDAVGNVEAEQGGDGQDRDRSTPEHGDRRRRCALAPPAGDPDVHRDRRADAGVDYTESSLDGGATWARRGRRRVVIGLAQGGADGPRPVQYRSVDLLGHVEAAQTVTVYLDTQRPVTKAPYRASVRRGRTVTLKYKVADLEPNSGRAKARIVVRNRNGRVVARLAWRPVPVNQLLGWRCTCQLKAGTYRFSVYATDLAGNKQVKVGSNRLVVR